jgi:hypothetical protein
MGLVLGLAVVAGGGPAVVGQPPAFKGKNPYTPGTVVKVLPKANTIVVRVGEGDKARMVDFKVDKNTRIWGPDRMPLNDGLYFGGFKEGADVWLRSQPGQSQQLLQDLHLYNPAVPPVPIKEE